MSDGLSSFTAAGSCWEVKQNHPDSPDGLYWLVTPTLQNPQQFHCDMTTDGGGWVLVGRGRQGWKDYYQGLRPALVSSPITGPEAFAPAQLEAKTIDGLLNGQRVDALTDGIRLRRATNTSGTAWQEARFQVDRWEGWAWTFPAERPVTSYSFDGVSGSGGQTVNFGSDNAYRRVTTTFPQNQGWVWGFSYGGNVTGTNSSSSYLWSNTTGQGNARPFTQVYLRPRVTLAELDLPAIPDAGTPVQEQSPLAESESLATVWGVSGLANGNAGELDSEVQAFAQVGNRVFVGGNFRYVERSSSGLDRVERPYLAAFDVNTGQFVSTFTPTLNNQVKTLKALPDGRLAVGGQFSTVNGQPQASLAFLNPSTGQLSGSQVTVENRSTGGVATVRNLDVQDEWLYVAGSFTHMSDAATWNGGRLRHATGQVDSGWNPVLNGTSVGLDASESGSRAYYSGYFRQAGDVATVSAAALSTQTGAAPVSPLWQPTFSRTLNNNLWQLAVGEGGDRVWLAGSEHSMFSYARDDFSLMEGHITKAGGDYQYMSLDGDIMYAGCHCDNWNYQNAFAWPSVGTSWTHADKIGQIGAYDTTNGDFRPDFSPVVNGRRGFGVWGIFTDSTGTMWVGGDFVSSVRVNSGSSFINQWSGGFMRFPARDTSAPTRPSGLTSALEGTDLRLSWNGSSDDRGVARYEILRDDRVVASTSSLSVVAPFREGRYFVRAVDAAGNRSASTEVHVVGPPPEELLTFISAGSDWSWVYDNDPWPAGWASVDFNDAGWDSGPAPLGRGSSLVVTNIMPDPISPQPLNAQFRHAFEVTDPTTVVGGVITTRADDGVVVFVNGVEVGRANMGTGTLSAGSYATAAPSAANAAANPVTFEVPSSLLVEGTNVVAASTHANYRSTPSLTFELTFTAERGEPAEPDPEPVAPSVSADASSGQVVLSWSADPEVEATWWPARSTTTRWSL
nr:fibrinogen-like YCDxxxxGGGW domain-containing protein [Ornithinimicrobium sediminis]